ncbi:flagellar hook protein [Leifsonia xyli subsp. cynodontis DSM 46306]|uniref:Flagellar hook-associated protein 1 n=1 Tax=Leifsonia xyli subsp. cynodontis DSM 46306 TaxID=1389489 RepID=U3P759_LEIXC|nr:flagellar hook-associated protein FlgK [Leifsonia xyli]AGW42125.1 flagellar hook protein [Leifsonia xyli subsp. cynodontis DSM 46306]
MTESALGALRAAYSGLQAAQAGMDIVGQNIDNANTVGYVRQSVSQQSVGQPGRVGSDANGPRSGQGVVVAAIVQSGSSLLDAQVRSTAADAAYSSVRSGALDQVQTILGEPSGDAISGRLQTFWNAWQSVANRPGSSAPVGALLGQAATLASTIGTAYKALQSQWSQTSGQLATTVSQLNADIARIADLNGQIRTAIAAGGNANELIDQRNVAAQGFAKLVGGRVDIAGDNTVSVSIGGIAVVQGTSFEQVRISGGTQLEAAGESPVRLVLASDPSGPGLTPSTGEIAGLVSLLGAAGTGGAIAETAAHLNQLATGLATRVNAISRTGVSSTGATGLDFFAIGASPALSLSVIPADPSGVATGAVGAGNLDGAVADKISQIGNTAASPDATWSASVVQLGTRANLEASQASLDSAALTSATTAQQSLESVDLDEENLNLLSYQHAYQGASRVMSALDEVLDQLINHTGHVGIA